MENFIQDFGFRSTSSGLSLSGKVVKVRPTGSWIIQFWFGLLTFSVGYCLYITAQVNQVICQIIQLAGFLVLIRSAFLSFRFNETSIGLKLYALIYTCCALWIISRNDSFSYLRIKEILFSADSGVLVLFVPLFIFLPRNPVFVKRLFQAVIVAELMYLLLIVFFYKYVIYIGVENTNLKFVFEYFFKYAGITAGFMLFTFRFHNWWKIILSLGVILTSLLFSIYKARRGLFFINSSILLIYFLLVFQYSRQRILLLTGLVFLGLIIYWGVTHLHQFRFFDFFVDRWGEDTRTGPEDCFFEDFSIHDWIFGRGLGGTYYCPNIDLNDTTGYRKIIETDYLNIILKGGWIYLGLLLVAALPALFRGIFFSKNLLGRAFGLWILIWLLSLYPLNVTTFSLNYILVWISIGNCYDSQFLSYSDEEMRKLIFRN